MHGVPTIRHVRTARAELCALLFALVCPTVVTVAYFVVLAGHPYGKAAYVIGKGIQFAFPLLWVLFITRQRLHIGRPTGRGLGLGLLFGMMVAATMLGLYLAILRPAGFFIGPAAAVREKVVQLGIATPALFAAAGVFYSLIHSLLEEYYWRWFVYGRLRTWLPLAPSLLIGSVGFMAHHVILLAVYFGIASPATWLFSIGVAVGGAVWAWLYEKTGSLYGPWLSHALVDAAIFIIGYDMLADTFR